MRDLTEEELKLAPNWATHYQVLNLSTKYKLNFVSNSWFCHLSNCNELSKVKSHNAGITSEDIVITRVRKPFDITKHEFDDADIKGAKVTVENNYLHFKIRPTNLSELTINKQDAIAISKALGVTGEDLQ